MPPVKSVKWVPEGYAPHSSHWGVFSAKKAGDRVEVQPFPGDPDPNEIALNFASALDHPARIARPAVRAGWLESGPGPSDRRGKDEYVEMEWDEVLDLLAAELVRVQKAHGIESIFGGSYGWSSAGRFHHAQSQVHRFLNTVLGGYVKSVNTYSSGASSVLLPHVMGTYEEVVKNNVSWEQLAEHTEIVLAFGGMALRNSRVAGGGTSRHVERDAMLRASARNCRFVLVSPIRDDLPEALHSEWVSPIPGTDTALMMAIVYEIVAAGLEDRAFLDRFCIGWEEFEPYLSGRTDGLPKSADWAGPITGVSAQAIRDLALSLPGKRVLVTVSHSLQRAHLGEQPVWMGLVLSAVLGQIGVPGGGYGYGLGALAYYGRTATAVSVPTLHQGNNAAKSFIPVARIADMLLNPGATYRYNGQTLTYPHVRLAYWAGGNPFHHHQDLNRLSRAFAALDTLVVHDSVWTATAKHADIVLPCTMTLERSDIAGNSNDPLMLPMRPVAEPFAEARDDYAIFSDLADRLGGADRFTEGRTVRGWLRHLYDKTRNELTSIGLEAPEFETFWAGDGFELPQKPDTGGMLRAFRADPDTNPLPTPSGRIEIYSKTIAGFEAEGCPGHPFWQRPVHTPDRLAPLILISNQPAGRLHSQLDFGEHSQSAKRGNREVVRMNPVDAAERDLVDGDTLRLFNARGACFATLTIDDRLRQGVAQLSTGGWYDPMEGADALMECRQGNPNVLTHDIGTSELAQGCCGQLTTIEIARVEGTPPATEPYQPPRIVGTGRN